MSEDGVLEDRRNGSLVIAMTNSGRRNAFHPDMRRRMCDLLIEASRDPSVRVVILTGADGHFCAGADLKRVADADASREALQGRLASMHELLHLIVTGPKPVVAAVEGDAFGAGLSMAVAADVLVASRSARFGASFAKIGLLPDMGLLHTLPLRIGLPTARRLLMTARTVDAQEALTIGLVDELTDPGNALTRALAYAEEIQKAAPLSLAAIKTAFADTPISLEAAMALELDVVPTLMGSEDYRIARDAFLNKTTVRFQGR